MDHLPVMAASMSAAIGDPLTLTGPKPDLVDRPVANFQPSLWGDRFLRYTPNADDELTEAQKELAKELKEEIRRELLSLASKPLMEQLCLINSIERLGIAYHFEEEIQDALQHIYDTTDVASGDLFLTSLAFRLLRQYGFNVSCDVFKRFIGSNGSLDDSVSGDVQGMLSFYEACHLRGHGETLLDEALISTTSKLRSLLENLSYPLKEHVDHALKKPLRRRLIRLECIHYIPLYQQDPSHHKTLLKFAKLDFNSLQLLQKKELTEMCRWWERVGITKKLPLRDRIVESYFWGSAVHFEPQYSIGKKICTMGCQILTSIDDVYDAYAMHDELEIFTEAVNRWDWSCLDQLPEGLRVSYQTLLLEPYEEMERDLAPQGRSEYVYHAREEMKGLCQSYLLEAKWRKSKYVPTFDEYMEKLAYRGSAFVAAALFGFLAMDMAGHDEFEWLRKLPKPIKAICLLLRFLDDIGADEVEKSRDHSALSIEAYMKQHGGTYEHARKEIYKMVGDCWKDLNQAMIRPTEVPMPLLMRILNFGRSTDVIYDDGQDGFTTVNKGMKENILSLYVRPMPI